MKNFSVAVSCTLLAMSLASAGHTAAQVVASQQGKAGVPVITLTLGSFDTHQNQLGSYANLLKQLAEGMLALKSALTEQGASEPFKGN